MIIDTHVYDQLDKNCFHHQICLTRLMCLNPMKTFVCYYRPVLLNFLLLDNLLSASVFFVSQVVYTFLDTQLYKSAGLVHFTTHNTNTKHACSIPPLLYDAMFYSKYSWTGLWWWKRVQHDNCARLLAIDWLLSTFHPVALRWVTQQRANIENIKISYCF